MPPKILNRLEVIDFLLERRFPSFRATEAASLNINIKPGSINIAERASSIQSYRNELMRMPPEKLQALAAEEQEKKRQEAIKRAKDEDDARFFNQSTAKADFQHWAKAAYWTLDEALALSFGKSPRVVSWTKIEPHSNISPFVQKFRDARDLALRAKDMGQLKDPVLPGVYIGWTRQNELEFPQELEDLVKSRGAVIGDWRTLYEKEAKDHMATQSQLSESIREATKTIASQSELIASQDGLFSRATDLIAAKDRIIQDLQGQLSELKTKAAKPENIPSIVREQDSLLKMVMGMAMACYCHNPKLARSSTAKEIAGDLLKHGLSLDQDTIRKFLQKGRDVLPPETE